MSDCEQAGFSMKKNRLYCRLFNYADVRARHAAGESVAAIAKDIGVSWAAVKRVVDPEYAAKLQSRSKEWMRDNYRKPCKGGCGRLVWMHAKSGRTGYCQACYGLLRCQTAQPGLLLCARCGDWKTDDEFPKQSSAKARRQRAGLCRPCQAAARQDYRERHKVPCSRCGKPALAENERQRTDRATKPTDLCRSCWQDTELPRIRALA